MPAYAVSLGSQEGVPTSVLTAHESGLEAVFAPGAGMIGCSLRHGGEELLGQRGGLAKYAETGSTMGLPLLHPWANRLDGLQYATPDRLVELDPQATPLRLDPNGLPIHGLAAALPYWEVLSFEATEDAARLSTRLDWVGHEDLLAGFPFPHELELRVTLAGRTLAIETTLRATGRIEVPVAFGFHPYLTLPGLAREEWDVRLPVRRRASLDDRGIPTGEDEPVRAEPGPLDGETFDDLFVELSHPPEFVLRGGGRCLEVRFEQGFPFAQVYAPADEDFICFEPMTAPTNALVTGERLTLVPPGGAHSTRFSISVYED